VYLVCVLDRKVTVLEDKDIGKVKFKWTYYSPKEVTCDIKYVILKEYLHMF
jgi:hypothetical protein